MLTHADYSQWLFKLRPLIVIRPEFRRGQMTLSAYVYEGLKYYQKKPQKHELSFLDNNLSSA
jgi:hypothetical protein